MRQIDTSTDQLVGAGVAVSSGDQVVVNAAITEAYVADSASGLRFVDLATGTSTTLAMPSGASAIDLAITDDDASLFVVAGAGVVEVDIATRTIVATTVVTQAPARVDIQH